MAENEDGGSPAQDGEAEQTKTEPKKKKGTKRKKDDDEEKNVIKRPLTAYMYFCKDQRADLAAANPDKKFGEIGKLLGEEWKALSEKEKRKYEEQNAVDKERFEQEKKDHPDWELSGKKKKDDGEGKPKRQKSAAKKDPNIPKRAVSAFFLYLAEQRPLQKAAGVVGKEAATVAGEQWKALSDADKKPYQEKYKENKVTADAAIKEYEEVHGKIEKKTRKKKTDDDDDGAEKKTKKKKTTKKKKAEVEPADDDGGGDD